MLRSSETRILAGSTPRSTRARAVKRIMISGPHRRARQPPGRTGVLRAAWSPGPRALSTARGPVDADRHVGTRAAPRARSSPKTSWDGSRAPTRTKTRPPRHDGRHKFGHRAPQRSQADAAGDDHHVAAVELAVLHGGSTDPVGAEGPTNPEDVAGARASAWVTAPTSRTVWRSGPTRQGAPLIETATSPTPRALTMWN